MLQLGHLHQPAVVEAKIGLREADGRAQRFVKQRVRRQRVRVALEDVGKGHVVVADRGAGRVAVERGVLWLNLREKLRQLHDVLQEDQGRRGAASQSGGGGGGEGRGGHAAYQFAVTTIGRQPGQAWVWGPFNGSRGWRSGRASRCSARHRQRGCRLRRGRACLWTVRTQSVTEGTPKHDAPPYAKRVDCAVGGWMVIWEWIMP